MKIIKLLFFILICYGNLWGQKLCNGQWVVGYDIDSKPPKDATLLDFTQKPGWN